MVGAEVDVAIDCESNNALRLWALPAMNQQRSGASL
jgi:hypothetical protein